MQFAFDGSAPLYQQLAAQIEEMIFTGGFDEEAQIPSTTQLSQQLHINPATVLKGMNMLVDEGLLEKRRGLGMFVRPGARQKIMERRKDNDDRRGGGKRFDREDDKSFGKRGGKSFGRSRDDDRAFGRGRDGEKSFGKGFKSDRKGGKGFNKKRFDNED